MIVKIVARMMIVFIASVLIIGSALFLWQPQTADAGIYTADQEVAYKEIWVEHRPWFTGKCEFKDGQWVDSHPNGTWYAEPLGWHNCPKELRFNISAADWSVTTKAEIYLDLWRNGENHSMRFRLNNGPERAPDVGSRSSRTPYVAEVPLSELKSGENIFTFWKVFSQYHLHDMAIRLYRNPATSPAPTGALVTVQGDGAAVSASAGGVLAIDGDQITLTATNISSNARYIEFHGYYFGYDVSNNGHFHDWHNIGRNNFHPGGALKQGPGEQPQLPDSGTIAHIGTVEVNNQSSVSITWDASLVPAQSNVRFKIRLLDHDGNVRDAAGGVSGEFTLTRTKPVVTFIDPNFQDLALGIGGSLPHQGAANVHIPVNPGFFQEAYMLGMYWNNPWFQINGQPGNAGPWNWNTRVFPQDADTWQLSVKGISINHLQQGNNVITFNYINTGHGHLVEKPGPMIVLKRTIEVVGDDDPPIMAPVHPQANATFVEPETPISVDLYDLGVGINQSSIRLFINDSEIPSSEFTISGGPHQYQIYYQPDSPFGYETVVKVEVRACDFNDNCINPENRTFSFTVTPENVSWTLLSDDFNVCNLGDNDISWEFISPAGVGSVEVVDGRYLELGIPGGGNYDIWRTNTLAPRLMQTVNSAINFDLIVKFNSQVTQVIQSQGILLEDDQGKFLRLNFQYQLPQGWPEDNRPIRIAGFLVEEGAASNPPDLINRRAPEGMFTGNEPMYLRLIRQQETWQLFYSANGVNWTSTPSFGLNMNVQKAGVYVGTNGPAYTAVIDYVFNNEQPIDPINAAALILPIEIVGQGWVERAADCGNPVIVEAFAEPGWTFDSWSGPAIGATNPITVTFDHGDVLMATFTQDEYDLDVTVRSIDHTGAETTAAPNQPGAGGQVSRSPDKPFYYYGDMVTLTAEPESGWVFTGWTGGGLSGSNPSRTITVQGHTQVTATFTQETYQLTVSHTGQGQVSVTGPGEGRGYYLHGEEATLEATPAANWFFAGWSGDEISVDNPLTVTMTGDMNIVAAFTDVEQFNLVIRVRSVDQDGLEEIKTNQPGLGGQVIRDPDQLLYDAGQQVTLTAVPNPGWVFTGWAGGGLSGNNLSQSITMNAHTTITATFTQEGAQETPEHALFLPLIVRH